jgi:molybdopterin converting factor small subunit
MAKLRLFARFREIAGTDTLEVPEGTVGEILDAAGAEYGPAFSNALKVAGVWVNGKPVDRDAAVGPDDEMALIPPVSGGAYATQRPSRPIATNPAEGILAAVVLAALLVSAWLPLAWFVVIAVGTTLAWLWDLGETNRDADASINLYATLAAPPIVAGATYAWGYAGFAGGFALAIAVAIFWPIFDARWRNIDSIAMTSSVVIVAGTGVGAISMLRMMGTPFAASFLLIVAAAIVAAVATAVYGGQAMDPNVGTLLGAIIAGFIAGIATTQIDLANALFASVALAAGLIAGRVFGSMVRSGMIVHTTRSPGQLSALDGLWIAAPVFWLVLALLG